MANQTSFASFSVPAPWLGAVITPEPFAPPAPPEDLIAGALRSPAGSPPLRVLARGAQRVTVLVDDCTRKTPTAQILPFVLGELAAAGVAPSAVTLVVALGTHRPLTEDELHHPLVPHYAGIDPDLLRRSLLSARVVGTAVAAADAPGHDALQAATGVLWGSLRKRVRLALVSAGLTAKDAAAMRAEYFADVEAAMAAALSRLPPAARAGAVAVIPQAGVVLPMPG